MLERLQLGFERFVERVRLGFALGVGLALSYAVALYVMRLIYVW